VKNVQKGSETTRIDANEQCIVIGSSGSTNQFSNPYRYLSKANVIGNINNTRQSSLLRKNAWTRFHFFNSSRGQM